MKKFIILFTLIFLPVLCFAQDEANLELAKTNNIQNRINNIGTNILNSNKIPRRVVFTYDKRTQKKTLTTDKALTKRQVIIYDGLYNSIETDDELAAMISREISTVIKSYDGAWGGTVDSIQVALSSKKFETAADKRAVDFLVKSGYNPLALIVYINKTFPQKRFDRFSRHNLTSKRLARIYEYITYKYPQYLINNEYINNKYYQNFLLTSIENRRKLEEKIRYHSNEEIKYE